MYPILFKIGGLSFYTHGLVAVLGIVLGTALIYYLAKKSSLSTGFLFDNIIYTVLFGIIGARLTFYLLYSNQFAGFREVIYLWQGGLVSIGGFVVGGFILHLLLKYQNQPIKKWFDVVVLGFALGLAIGRFGEYFADEFAGVKYSGKFSINGVFPVTTLEGLWVLLILILLLILKKFKNPVDGVIFSFFLILYGGGRFVIDFMRDERNLFLNISIGQIASLIIMTIGIVLLFKNRIGVRNEAIG